MFYPQLQHSAVGTFLLQDSLQYVFFFPCAGSSLLWAVDKLFLVVASKGHSLVVVHRLFIAGASLVAEHRL